LLEVTASRISTPEHAYICTTTTSGSRFNPAWTQKGLRDVLVHHGGVTQFA
jgi:hypothetical protein